MAGIFERTRTRFSTQNSVVAERATKAAANRRGGGGMPDISRGAAAGGSMFGNNESQRISQNYALFKHWTYVAINAIARRLAGQPIGMGRVNKAASSGKGVLISVKDAVGAVTPEAKAEQIKTAERLRSDKRCRWKAGKFPPMVMTKATDPDALEIITNHEILDALEKPNAVQHKAQFLYCIAASLYITGVAYIISGVGEDGRKEYWAIPSTWLEPVHNDKDGLFCAYKMRTNPMKEPETIPAEVVGRIYFPDPADLKSVLSPLKTVTMAIKTDDKIQTSQEQMFEQGIFPNVVLTVGKQAGPDGTQARPVLSGAQTRQLLRAVRQRWMQTGGAGDPAIVDGLIESITKLSNVPAEMDWLNSGQQVKSRIFQAFNVNPIVVGEITPSNRAQAVEADKNFCSNAVNPVCDAISTCLTDLTNREGTGGAGNAAGAENLLVWIEPAIPIDEDQKLRKWQVGLQYNAVKKDEYRGEMLNLPPSEDEGANQSALLSTVGGIQGALAIVTAVGQGQIDPEAAVQMLIVFFQLEEDVARGMVGDPPEPPEQPPGGLGAKPTIGAGGAAGAAAKPADGQDDDSGDDDAADGGKAFTGAKGTLTKIPRRAVKAAHVAQHAALESEVSRQLASFFVAKGGKLLAEFGILGNRS